MPDVENSGLLIGMYVDIAGTKTLVAAKRGMEIEESADMIDVSHADNMKAPIRVLSMSAANDTVTLSGDRRVELNSHPEFALQGTAAENGAKTAASVSLNGSNNTVVTVAGGIANDTFGLATAFVVAPYGFPARLRGEQDWNASWDGVMLLDDQTGDFAASHNALREAKRTQSPVTLEFRYPHAGASIPRDESEGVISSVTLTAPYDAEATVAVEIESATPLNYITS